MKEKDSIYLCQGGSVFISIYLFVCLIAGFDKNHKNDFHKIWWKGGTWTTEKKH